MALTASIIDFKVVMDRDASGGPVFTFTDQTDYDGNLVPPVTFEDVRGALKIEYGTTSYYDNLANLLTDPDIDCSDAGQTNGDATRANTQATAIALPTDSNGNVISGQYTFTYRVTDGAATVTNTTVIDATFSLPSGDLTGTVDLTPTSPKITVTDVTNYVVQNVTPTGTPEITLYYPADAGASPSVVNASILEVTTFYTGQQVAKLSSAKTWNYSSKVSSQTITSTTVGDSAGTFTLEIQDTVTDRIEIDVEVNNNICSLYCCLNEFGEKLQASKSRPSEYARLLDIAGTVAFYYQSISAAYDCSKTANVNLWVEEIRALVGCSDDCACDDGAPVQISPLSGAAGGEISGNIGTGEVAFGAASNTITGDAAFTYNSVDDVLTTEGHVLTPQAANPETTNPLTNLWINSEDGHLYRGDRDTESTVHFNVRNDEGVTIPLGAPLYSKGEIGGSNRILVGVADATDANKMPVIGIAMEEMNTTSTKDGNAIASGILNEDINSFSGLTNNKVLYVAAHGGTWTTVADLLTPTKPTGAVHLVQNVGICIRHTGGTTMRGFKVAAVGRTNDTPNTISVTGSITGEQVIADKFTTNSPPIPSAGSGPEIFTYDIDNGSIGTMSITDVGGNTLQLANLPANTTVKVEVTQGGISIPWPNITSYVDTGGGTVIFSGGGTPTITQSNGRRDILTFTKIGTNVYASIEQNY